MTQAVMKYASASSGQCAHAQRVAELEAEVKVLKAKLKKFADRELATLSRRTTATSRRAPAPPNMQTYIQQKRAGKSNNEAMRAARAAS